MKSKTILKASIIAIIIGCVFTGVGYTINGGVSFEQINKKEHTRTKNIKMVNESKELETFKNIDMQVEINNIEIIPSDKYKIELRYGQDYGKIDYKIEKNTLIITQENRKRNFGYDLDFNENNKFYIKIYIPQNTEFDKIDIVSNVANIKLEELYINKLNLSCDVGNTEINKCKINESNLSTDTGNMELQGIEASKVEAYGNLGNITIHDSNVSDSLKADNDLGNIEVSGKIYGEIYIGADLGSIELYIDEEKSKYNYSVNCDLGGVEIDGKRQSKDLEVDNNSKNNINLDCNSGNIELNFK